MTEDTMTPESAIMTEGLSLTPSDLKLIFEEKALSEKTKSSTRNNILTAIEIADETFRDSVSKVPTEDYLKVIISLFNDPEASMGTQESNDATISFLESTLEEKARERDAQTEVEKLNNAIETISILAGEDPLTGVKNRRAWFNILEYEFTQQKRTKEPLAVIMIDMDGLKAINDRFGHLTGDQAITSIVHTVEKIIRDSDSFGRFGGDEFVVLLPNTNEAQAQEISQRIQEELDANTIHNKSEKIESSGTVAQINFNPQIHKTTEDFIDGVDKKLLSLKEERKTNRLS